MVGVVYSEAPPTCTDKVKQLYNTVHTLTNTVSALSITSARYGSGPRVFYTRRNEGRITVNIWRVH